jgi:hypothetical protein
MVDDDLSRSYVNDHIARIKRIFKWAVADQLVPATTYQALAAVPGQLTPRHHTRLREGERRTMGAEPATA